MEEYTITQFFNDYFTAQTLQEKQEIVSRGKECGFFNQEASLLLKEDGSLIQLTDKTNNQIMQAQQQNETATEKNVTANRENKTLDDLLINNQKFNAQLLELSDNSVLYDNSNKAIGNFTLNGTVLAKTWDIAQNRYILTRRKIRTPLFSSVLDIPQPQDALDLDIQAITSLDMGLAQKIKSDREAAALLMAPMYIMSDGTIYHQKSTYNYTNTTTTINVSGGIGTATLTISGGLGIGTGSGTVAATGTLPANTENIEGLVNCSKTYTGSTKSESGTAKHTIHSLKSATYSSTPFTSAEQVKQNALQEIYPPIPTPIKATNEKAGVIDNMDYVYKIGGAVCTCYSGDGVTASGKPCTDKGEICAAHGLPFGTQVYIPALKDINGTGIFEVADVGGPFFDFDINTTKNIGKVMTNAYILKWGTGATGYSFSEAMVEQHINYHWYKDSADISDAYFQYYGLYKTENLKIVT